MSTTFPNCCVTSSHTAKLWMGQWKYNYTQSYVLLVGPVKQIACQFSDNAISWMDCYTVSLKELFTQEKLCILLPWICTVYKSI